MKLPSEDPQTTDEGGNLAPADSADDSASAAPEVPGGLGAGAPSEGETDQAEEYMYEAEAGQEAEAGGVLLRLHRSFAAVLMSFGRCPPVVPAVACRSDSAFLHITDARALD